MYHSGNVIKGQSQIEDNNNNNIETSIMRQRLKKYYQKLPKRSNHLADFWKDMNFYLIDKTQNELGLSILTI